MRFRVYRAIEHWGDDWDQAAIIAATTANAMRSKGRAAKLEDFRPVYKRRKQQSDDEVADALMAFFKVG